jgi:hypothetical protein
MTRLAGTALLAFALLLFLALPQLGCGATGNRYAYSTVILEPTLAGSGRVSVATQDSREYVVSGEKPPQFVGIQRGGTAGGLWGVPFDVRTSDDRPLADIVTAAIVAATAQRGFQSVPVFVARSADAAQAVQALFRDGSARALFLTLREWKTDTFVDVGLQYEVALVVKAGAFLAEKRLRGTDNLGGSVTETRAHARRVVPLAFKAKLEELLSDPAVAAALR